MASWQSNLYVIPAMLVIKFLVYLYDFITFPIYSLFRRPFYFMTLPETEEDDFFVKYGAKEARTLSLTVVDGDPGSDWRAAEYIDGLVTEPMSGCETITKMWMRNIKLTPHHSGFGTRAVLATEFHTLPNGKEIVKQTMGEYVWETYIEAEQRVSKIAAGLRKILGPRPISSTKYDIAPIVIFSETRCEWMYAAQAAFRVNRPLATLYATLGDDAVVQGLQLTEAKVIFTSEELLSKVVTLLNQCPLVERVIFFSNGVIQKRSGIPINNLSRLTDTGRRSVEKAKAICPKNVILMDLLEVEQVGAEVIDEEQAEGWGDEMRRLVPYVNWQPPKEERPKPSDLAIIMFTSGSTGTPKGVELTHNNLLTSIAGYFRRLPKIRLDSDVYIAYLPLAHVLELVCELYILLMGVPIGYSHPQTLTDNASKIKIGACKGDITVLKPTLFAGVPTILERVTKAVWERVRDGGPLLEAIFHFAFDYKHRRLHRGFPSFMVDILIFNKVRALLGGRLRYIVAGGAPLSEETHLFFNVCFSPVMIGYGLTESCASGCLMECGDLRSHHTGAPTPSIQVKLVEWPEGGYSPYDKPFPRGEMWISGGPITLGYYKNPQTTAESFVTDKDGTWWFCTGDIGMVHEDGSFSIIDRKKDLVKLQGGEYVSLMKVELALAQSSYVEIICIYAEPTEDYTIAFVMPKRTMIRKLGEELGLLEGAIADARKNLDPERLNDASAVELAEHQVLCGKPEIIKRVLADIQTVGRSRKLAAFEIPAEILLDPDAWTPESGLVTDALKIKRHNLKTKFIQQIQKLYNRK